MKENKFFPALATLVGTTIGAGFLGIPYVVSKSGFIIGFFYLIAIALFMLLINLYLGEVSLRTKGNHQLTGYADTYLGKKGKILMFLAMLFGIYSALLAYLIGEGTSLSYLFFGNFNYSFHFSILFWFILSILTHIGLVALKKYEKINLFLVSIIIIIIFLFCVKDIKIENLTYTGNNFFLPFGVILFSFLAFSALPEIGRILQGQESKMKKVIIFSFLISFLIYLIFTISIVGVFGRNVEEIATLSLPRFFSILGILTMFSAFFALSIAIRDMFRFDFKLGRFKGWLLCSFVPLLLFILLSYSKLLTFTQILSYAGIISGGLTGILILLMNLKAKKIGNRKPEYRIKINKLIIFILSLIFILAVLLEIFWV